MENLRTDGFARTLEETEKTFSRSFVFFVMAVVCDDGQKGFLLLGEVGEGKLLGKGSFDELDTLLWI